MQVIVNTIVNSAARLLLHTAAESGYDCSQRLSIISSFDLMLQSASDQSLYRILLHFLLATNVYEAVMRVYKIVSCSVVILVITVLFASAVTVPAAAQYDTMIFRYNAQHTGNYSPMAGSNVSKGLLTWSFTTGSIVLSSPAVVNGIVYVGSEDNNTYALNATTGAKVWSFTTGSGVFSSPAVANSTVYVGSIDGDVYAIGNAAAATSQTATPGFSVLLALVGLVIAAYVVRRRS